MNNRYKRYKVTRTRDSQKKIFNLPRPIKVDGEWVMPHCLNKEDTLYV